MSDGLFRYPTCIECGVKLGTPDRGQTLPKRCPTHAQKARHAREQARLQALEAVAEAARALYPTSGTHTHRGDDGWNNPGDWVEVREDLYDALSAALARLDQGERT